MAKNKDKNAAKSFLESISSGEVMPGDKDIHVAPNNKDVHVAPNNKPITKQKGFYIDSKLEKAMQLRIALSDDEKDKNKSSIVNSALSEYLKSELSLIKNSENLKNQN